MPKKNRTPKTYRPQDYSNLTDLAGITAFQEPPDFFYPGAVDIPEPPIQVAINQVGQNNYDIGLEELEYEITLDSNMLLSDISDSIGDMVMNVIEDEDLGADDIIQVNITDDITGDDYGSDPVSVEDVDYDFADFIDISDGEFEWKYNKESGQVEQVYPTASITIQITRLTDYEGDRSNCKILTKDTYKLKKSVISVNNTDKLCLGRCITIQKAIWEEHPQLKQIKMGRNIQTELTNKLYEDLLIPKVSGSLKLIKSFEDKLDCCITIIDTQSFNNVVYPDVKDESYTPKEKNIYLLKSGKHFDLINSKQMAGFFCSNNWCHKCKQSYTSKEKHICDYKCGICCSKDCDFIAGDFTKVKEWFKCEECWRSFPTQNCFDNHKIQHPITRGINKGNMKPSCCQSVFKCPKCKVMYDKEKFDMETHKCGDFWCGNCKSVANKGHKCYMMPCNLKAENQNIIFFDFEATQNTKNKKHIVNYCIAQYLHDPTPIEFFNIDDFMNWLLDKKHETFIVIAHNGRGYDFQLIQEWIYLNTSMKPSNVYAGSKIMILKLQELQMRFVDSLNFLTMKLEKFPKTFGLTELKKGFFPHYHNTAENFNYIGKIPDMKYFGYNGMNTQKREEFIKWWVAKRLTNYTWNQYEEMKAYCISDVDILRRSCIIFRQLYLDICDIDPFQYTTIASVCMAIYKNKFLYPGYVDTRLLDPELQVLQRLDCMEDEKVAILPYEQQQFIRQSFFGGRTNAIKLKYTFKGKEEGRYADITSLYPTVNYYDEYPAGHPEEITENFGDVTKYFGFVDCFVIPPKDLYFPVLAKKGKKLTFDLINKRGVWTTIELNKAIEKGYKVVKIFKVLHFKKRITGIFKEYVDTFLKIKQESSGFPDWVKTDKDKLDYVKKYEKEQGILLDIENIKENPGLRAIAKLCLNSLWGKFGQRTNMPKTEIITDKKRFHNILLNTKLCNKSYHMIDDKRMEISYKANEDDVEDDFNTNIAIASFTTSHARLRLYYALDLLGDQVLYHDTDSVVYVFDPDNPNHKELELGDNLGDWTDEMEGGVMKGTFISGGPKNYSYEKHKKDKVCWETKIKGFTLNYDATGGDEKSKNKLNHFSMIDMVDNHMKGLDPIKNKIVVDYFMINRNKKSKVLNSYTQKKAYGFCYDKRHILPYDEWGNIGTLPFGHRGINK
tara:strand:- start:29 stop:3553 length:3525 start_codon:yes stop_codon:yes gene_type:complete